MEIDKIYLGDCLELMPLIPDKSVDMICADNPYNVLSRDNENAQWDTIIPFEPLWEQYERVIKDNGAIVLFAQGMFTAQLMMSNPKLWRYNLVWYKGRATGFLNANRMPLRCHEDICVFYKSLPTYNPQMEIGTPSHSMGSGKHKETNRCYGKHKVGRAYDYDKGIKKVEPTRPDEKFPMSIINIAKEHESSVFHPTQKAVDLIRYLIRTYTNEGETVLDNCSGSGTAAIAALRENRHFICIEKNPEYWEKSVKRLNIELSQPTLF